MNLLTMALPCLIALFGATAPVPAILDTDIGDDIDDTWALCMLLGSPQVDLQLVVTAFDNTPKKASLVAKILEQNGRTDIPIGIGKQTSEKAIHQEKWLADYTLDKYKGVIHHDGVQALIDTLKKAPQPMTLIVIGPHTNIAEALKRDPSIAQKARIVAMEGSVYIGYGGKKTGRDPEWNVVCDIPAARAVFDAPWDITITPLDSCGQMILKGERFKTIWTSKNERAKTVADNFREWTNFAQYPTGESSVLYDTVAAYLAFDESLCQMKTERLIIDDKGNTVPDDKGRPIHYAADWKNRDAFEDLLIKSLTK